MHHSHPTRGGQFLSSVDCSFLFFTLISCSWRAHTFTHIIETPDSPTKNRTRQCRMRSTVQCVLSQITPQTPATSPPHRHARVLSVVLLSGASGGLRVSSPVHTQWHHRSMLVLLRARRCFFAHPAARFP